MAITVVQRNIAGNAAVTTTPTLAYGSNVTAGNALITFTVIGADLSNAARPTDTLNNTYVPLSPASVSGMCIVPWVVYKSPGGANTVTFTTGFQNSAIIIFEVSGLAASGAFDVTAFSKQSAATSLTSGNTATTRLANELLLGVTINIDSGGTLLPTAGSGFSNLQTAGVVFASTGSEEKIVSSTGVQAATFTLGANSTNELTAIYTFADTPATYAKLPNSGLRPAPFKPGLAR